MSFPINIPISFFHSFTQFKNALGPLYAISVGFVIVVTNLSLYPVDFMIFFLHASMLSYVVPSLKALHFGPNGMDQQVKAPAIKAGGLHLISGVCMWKERTGSPTSCPHNSTHAPYPYSCAYHTYTHTHSCTHAHMHTSESCGKMLDFLVGLETQERILVLGEDWLASLVQCEPASLRLISQALIATKTWRCEPCRTIWVGSSILCAVCDMNVVLCG